METKIKNHYEIKIILAITAIVVFLSLAYSNESATTYIEGIMAKVRPMADVRVTDISLFNATNNGISNSEDYNINNIYGSVTLPSQNAEVTYKVDVTTFLGAEMKITMISGLSDNLVYELSGYTLNTPLCNTNNECNYGSTATFYITIKTRRNWFDSENITHSFNINFNFEEMNYIAQLDNKKYETLQEAINKVPTDNVEKTIIVLKNTSELLTIAQNKNINLDIQNNTISNTGTSPVIENYGTLKISNGIITSNTTQGAINNKDTGTLIMSGGSIIATGTRQAIYNGGNVTISGNAYLSSSTSQRATVQNLATGTVTITGGTIISTGQSAVENAGILTIGVENQSISESIPRIQGNSYGINTTTGINYYDGILLGKNQAINNQELITDKEDGYSLYPGTEVVNSQTYKTIILAITNTITFNPNEGTCSEAERIVKHGQTPGILPIPTRTDYEFDGWFTSGGTEVTKNTVITDDLNLIAHWTHYTQVIVARNNLTGAEYQSLQTAINEVPTNTQTTITITRNIQEVLNIQKNKIITLDMSGKTLSNKGVANVIVNNGTLNIINGTITSNTTQGAINNESTATLNMSGGEIIATGSRQAIYNNGGRVNISGTAYLTSSTSDRATVQNLASGTIVITGGTIKSTGRNAVENVGTLTIGVKDGTIDTSSPTLIGHTVGLNTTGRFYFYDGTIKGITSAITGNITEIEDNSQVINSTEVINERTYQTKYLA